MSRIEHKVYEITCDGCGRKANFEEDHDRYDSWSTVRFEAPISFVGGIHDAAKLDYCNSCTIRISNFLSALQEYDGRVLPWVEAIPDASPPPDYLDLVEFAKTELPLRFEGGAYQMHDVIVGMDKKTLGMTGSIQNHPIRYDEMSKFMQKLVEFVNVAKPLVIREFTPIKTGED